MIWKAKVTFSNFFHKPWDEEHILFILMASDTIKSSPSTFSEFGFSKLSDVSAVLVAISPDKEL